VLNVGAIKCHYPRAIAEYLINSKWKGCFMNSYCWHGLE